MGFKPLQSAVLCELDIRRQGQERREASRYKCLRDQDLYGEGETVGFLSIPGKMAIKRSAIRIEVVEAGIGGGWDGTGQDCPIVLIAGGAAQWPTQFQATTRWFVWWLGRATLEA